MPTSNLFPQQQLNRNRECQKRANRVNWVYFLSSVQEKGEAKSMAKALSEQPLCSCNNLPLAAVPPAAIFWLPPCLAEPCVTPGCCSSHPLVRWCLSSLPRCFLRSSGHSLSFGSLAPLGTCVRWVQLRAGALCSLAQLFCWAAAVAVQLWGSICHGAAGLGFYLQLFVALEQWGRNREESRRGVLPFAFSCRKSHLK